MTLEHQNTGSCPHFLSLREIASWHDISEITEKPEIRASVPILQRGLVWNPSQIELLWDSILRGFPIGALVLSSKIAEQEKNADKNKPDASHHLLDGQQRCDAIALGFKDPFRKEVDSVATIKADPILWLDLNPTDDVRSTREFLVRLTTASHPWGYTRSDSTNPLTAWNIREALAKIGLNPATDGYKRPSPAELSPQEAIAPVPLAWLLLGTKEADLWSDIKRRLDNSSVLPWHFPLRSFLEDKGAEKQREKIANALKRIETTRIVALVAPDDLLNISRQETANSQEQTNISNIEHLFQRLNQQGTTLDGEELAYSMIKAYWPKLAGPIDDIPKLMPATRLVSLGIRAALSDESREQLPSGLGVSGIRNMARKGDEKTTLVYNYIKDELGQGCNQIRSWLSYDKADNKSGLLPVHVGSIAHDSPNVFLLLLTFAKRPTEHWEPVTRDWPRHFQALATMAHWFARNEGNVANHVFAACANQITLENVKLGLAEALKNGDIRPIHAPADLETFLDVKKDNLQNWDWDFLFRVEGTDAEEAKRKLWDKWGEFLWFREQKEMLLYAQRDFINRRFEDYDPTRKDFWKGHNRPWDFDHILAWMFVNNRKDGSPFRETAKKWAKTIGNFRAWPFEDNRSDQADIAADKLSGDHGELKRQNSFLESEELDWFSSGDKVRWEPDHAFGFVLACRKRMLRIYREWYDSVGVADLVSPVGDTTPPAIATLPNIVVAATPSK